MTKTELKKEIASQNLRNSELLAVLKEKGFRKLMKLMSNITFGPSITKMRWNLVNVYTKKALS